MYTDISVDVRVEKWERRFRHCVRELSASWPHAYGKSENMQGFDSCASCAILLQMWLSASSCAKSIKLAEIARELRQRPCEPYTIFCLIYYSCLVFVGWSKCSKFWIVCNSLWTALTIWFSPHRTLNIWSVRHLPIFWNYWIVVYLNSWPAITDYRQCLLITASHTFHISYLLLPRGIDSQHAW